MKRAGLIALVLVLVLILAGCTSVDEGEVVAKEHSPLAVNTTWVKCGQASCPITQVYPERWSIRVCEDRVEDVTRVGESGRPCQWWPVSEEYYDATQVGDQVSKDEL